MSTEPVFILKEVKVVCFDTLLEVLILKIDTAAPTDRREIVGGRSRSRIVRVCHPGCFRKRVCKLLETKEWSAKQSAKRDKEAANRSEHLDFQPDPVEASRD